jgi:hypothetical protein
MKWDDIKPVQAEPNQQNPNVIKWDDIQPQEEPTLGSFLFGDTSAGDYAKARMEAIKSAVSPETLKRVGHELANFPPFPEGKLTPQEGFTQPGGKEAAMNAVLSVMPVTPLSGAARMALLKPRTGPEAVKLASAQAAREAGFVIPPSEIYPTTTNTVLESISGKAPTRQGASRINQQTTDRLISESIGIPKNTPITEQVLENIRTDAGKAYQAVKNVNQPMIATKEYITGIRNLSGDFAQAAKEFPDLVSNEGVETLAKALTVKKMSPTAAVEISKKLRFDAKANLKSFDDPARLVLGRSQRDAADLVENLVGSNLKLTGKEALAKQWNDARTLIAKVHDAETAFNPGTGSFDAKVFARLQSKGKPLSGGMEEVANFAATFPREVQRTEMAGSPNVSKLQATLASLLAGMGGYATGGPGAMLGALPFVAPPIARRIIFSAPYQNALIRGAGGETALNNFLMQRAILGGGLAMQDQEQNALQ